MSARTAVLTATATLALVVTLPAAANATTLEQIDRSLFDATPEITASSWHVDGLTRGPLGGALDLVITAADGAFPTTKGACEPADVRADLQVSPGEVLRIVTTGEVCAHPVDASLSINASFGRQDVSYSGTAHKKAAVVGDGFIAAANSWLGGQASVSAAVRW